MPVRCMEHQDLVGEKDERGKTLSAKVERSAGKLSLRESWIRGLRTAGLYPLAGLLDYEDMRLKTSYRVRMGLSLAWKASLAIRM